MAVDPIGNVERAIELFTEIATSDPISGVLLAFGALFVTVSVVVFGGLSLGGVAGAIGRLAEASDQRD
jgi:hypothetical protein